MGNRGDGDHEVMKKIAMAVAGLSLLGMTACMGPGYGYNAYTGGSAGHGHDHGNETYYLHPSGNCVVPGALSGGLAGLAAYALADEVLDWSGPINKDELILSGFVGAGIGGLIGSNSYCPRYGL